MNNKLNKQYFETRKDHDEKTHPYAWLYFLLMLVVAIGLSIGIVSLIL